MKRRSVKIYIDLFDSDSDNRLNEQELDIFLRSQYNFLRKFSENSAENIKLHKEKISLIPVERSNFVIWSLQNIALSEILKLLKLSRLHPLKRL